VLPLAARFTETLALLPDTGNDDTVVEALALVRAPAGGSPVTVIVTGVDEREAEVTGLDVTAAIVLPAEGVPVATAGDRGRVGLRGCVDGSAIRPVAGALAAGAGREVEAVLATVSAPTAEGRTGIGPETGAAGDGVDGAAAVVAGSAAMVEKTSPVSPAAP